MMRLIGGLLAFLALLAQAQADPGFSVHACYSYGSMVPCGSAPYSPHVRSGNESINEMSDYYRRYGLPQSSAELDRFRQKFESVPKPLTNDQAGQLAYEHFRTQLGPILNIDISQLPANVAQFPTPVPAGLDRDALQAELDPLWKSLKDPVATAGEVEKLASKIAALKRTGETAKRKYLVAELTRTFVDSRGVLKDLPFASAPKTGFLTKPFSEQGIRIRKSLNSVMAAQSVVGAHCSSHPELGSQCAAFNSYAEDLKLGHALADRLAAFNRADAYQSLMSQLEPAANFISGFASGVVSSGIDLATGLAKLVTDFPEVAQGMYHALSDLPGTWSKIKSAAEQKYDTLLNGTAEERGEIIGQITFEIAGLLVGAEEVAAVARSTGLLAHGAELAATRAAANFAADAAIAAGEMTGEVATAFRTLSRFSPEAAASYVKAVSELDSIRAGARLGDNFVKTLEDLRVLAVQQPAEYLSLAEAFEGPILRGTVEPGDIIIQAQRKGATSPGSWFTSVVPLNPAHADEMLNITKYENMADQLRVYVVKERASVYAGKVAGGTGHQIYFPKGSPLSEIVGEVSHIPTFRKGIE